MLALTAIGALVVVWLLGMGVFGVMKWLDNKRRLSNLNKATTENGDTKNG